MSIVVAIFCVQYIDTWATCLYNEIGVLIPGSRKYWILETGRHKLMYIANRANTSKQKFQFQFLCSSNTCSGLFTSINCLLTFDKCTDRLTPLDHHCLLHSCCIEEFTDIAKWWITWQNRTILPVCPETLGPKYLSQNQPSGFRWNPSRGFILEGLTFWNSLLEGFHVWTTLKWISLWNHPLGRVSLL